MKPTTPGCDVRVRLAADRIVALDALATTLSQPWRKATRADALRVVIAKGLEVFDPNAPVTRRREKRSG